MVKPLDLTYRIWFNSSVMRRMIRPRHPREGKRHYWVKRNLVSWLGRLGYEAFAEYPIQWPNELHSRYPSLRFWPFVGARVDVAIPAERIVVEIETSSAWTGLAQRRRTAQITAQGWRVFHAQLPALRVIECVPNE